jgi:hypothetical protein
LNKGISAFIQRHPDRHSLKKHTISSRIINRLKRQLGIIGAPKIEKIQYSRYSNNFPQYQLKENEYPMVFPDWDNSPRCGHNGWLFLNSTPEDFRRVIEKSIQIIKRQKSNRDQIMIIKSWNEWAEGNYMEPDREYGLNYLKVLKEELDKAQ